MSSEELKRYDAYGNAMAPGDPDSLAIFVLATDYAALEAELERRKQLDQEALEFRQELIRERDEARAQLAAIQGGMGEANKHGAQPEVAENTGSHAMATNQLPRQEQAVARDVDGVAAPCEASPGDDIFAWATFDGEGSYDLRLFDGNESYRDDFRRNNPKHHPDWVFPLYRNSITAAMAAEVERHRAANRDLQQMHAADRCEIERLRAELAEVKGREAACFVIGKLEKTAVIAPPLPVGTKLYTSPPAATSEAQAHTSEAAPGIAGLVKALEGP